MHKMAARPVRVNRTIALYSMKGVLWIQTIGSLGNKCHQKEYLKKKGRSSSTGEMSSGERVMKAASFNGSPSERNAWYELATPEFRPGAAEILKNRPPAVHASSRRRSA